MFAISKPKLSFGEISHYWSQEITESYDEILAFLEQAWWRREIRTESGSRLKLLKGMFDWWCKHCSASIAFVTPEDAAQPEPPPDESVLVDMMRATILIPSKYPDEWSEDSCANAYQLLADAPSLTYYPERSPGFLAMQLSRDEFLRLLSGHGREFPSFWRAPIENIQPEREGLSALLGGHGCVKERSLIASGARKRGPPPLKLESVKDAMRGAIQKDQLTPDGLRDMRQK
jgi:hypothetical protein